jgi:chromosome segregation ATPase
MASKADSSKVRGLDDALKRSFTNIKNDMTALKEGVHQQGIKLAEAKQDLKDSKSDFVTLDKFNILKIKIGELNENMKKVWDTEKKLEDLDRKAVSSSEFDKQVVELNNEIAKLKQDLKDLVDSATTEDQTKGLVEDINSEFDNVKQSIEELRSIKDAITKEELDKRTDKLNKKAKEVKEGFEKVKAEVKSKVSMTQVESLVSDLNSEFDRIKDMIAAVKEGESRFALESDVENDLDSLEKKFRELQQAMTTAMDDFSKGVETTIKDISKATDKGIESCQRDIEKADVKQTKKLADLKKSQSKNASDVKKEMKTLVTKKQVENLVSDLNKEFDSVKDDNEGLAKDFAVLRKDAATKKEMQSSITELQKELDRLAKDLGMHRKEAATKKETKSLFDELRDRVAETNRALKDRFDELVKRIRKESDLSAKSIKSNSQDINAVDKDIRKELKTAVHEQDLHEELDVIQEEFEKLHSGIAGIQDTMLEEADLTDVDKRLKQHIKDTKADFVSKKQFDRLASAFERLEDQVEVQRALLSQKRKELKAHAKELKAAKRAEKKLAKYESVMTRSEKKALKKAKKAGKAKAGPAVPFRKSTFLGNFLVGAAFVILVVAIGFFFSGLTGMTDALAIAAVACFVIGIVIRIVVAFKRNGS